MYKMRANAVCHSVPLPKVYSVLPPPKEDLDEVLAFLYFGPTQPTPEDYKGTPFFVRQNKVIAALEWLKLNHVDYVDIEISEKNMSGYSENLPPVYVDFQLIENVKNPQATAVNDNEEDKGIAECECPFTVHALTSDELTA